jgi:hypothetical protein
LRTAARVLLAVLAPFDVASSQSASNVDYSHAVGDASTGLQRIAHDVRQAYALVGWGPSFVDFKAVMNGSDMEIMYDCGQPYPNNGNPNWQSYHRCTRVSVATGGILPSPATGEVVIDRVLNTAVFSYQPDINSPTFIEAKIQVPARGARYAGQQHNVILDNGMVLRNLVLGF